MFPNKYYAYARLSFGTRDTVAPVLRSGATHVAGR
jgi:hypothetical protein